MRNANPHFLDRPPSTEGATSSRLRVTFPKAAQIVAEAIREQILKRNFPTGSRLPSSEELMEEFGISRPTLREALNSLESEGLVRMRRGPGGGAIVQAPDGASILSSLESLLRFEGTTLEQVMAVRCVIDPLAARLAAEHATREQLARLSQSLEKQRDPSILSSGDLWFRENLAFHFVIAAASQNPLVRVLSEALFRLVLEPGPTLALMTDARRSRSVDEHEAVYDAIATRDPDRAESAIRAHLEHSLEAIAQPGPSAADAV